MEKHAFTSISYESILSEATKAAQQHIVTEEFVGNAPMAT
jgi:hypothetical protein